MQFTWGLWAWHTYSYSASGFYAFIYSWALWYLWGYIVWTTCVCVLTSSCCRVLPVWGPVLLGYSAKRRSVDVDQHHHPNPGKSCRSALSYYKPNVGALLACYPEIRPCVTWFFLLFNIAKKKSRKPWPLYFIMWSLISPPPPPPLAADCNYCVWSNYIFTQKVQRSRFTYSQITEIKAGRMFFIFFISWKKL